MSISSTRYVMITSGVAAGAGVAQRELIMRLFNDNPLIPVNAVLEFTSAADVGAYFGLTAPEYLRAKFYFGFVSKAITQAQKISFGRYAKATSPANIYGAKAAYQLATFTAINAGSLNLECGGQSIALNAVSLAGCASLAAVAAAVQAAIRAAGAQTQFALATVTYDAVGQRFVFTSATSGPGDLNTPPTGTVAVALGWTAATAILSPGTGVQTIDGALAASAAISNNFGSFGFVPALQIAEVTAAATWNDAQGVNFIGCIAVADAATANTVLTAILALGGNAVTLAPIGTEYPEMVPGIIMAATDYTASKSVQNFMFNQFNLTPSVTDDTTANTLDAERCNYYGVTQSAGQKIAFYQRGLLTGTGTAPTDQNTYANECWFKSAAQAAIFTGLLALTEIPANPRGAGILSNILQAVIKAALRNGTISVGKSLTATQQAAITTISGDPRASFQVQSLGYWLGITFQPYVTPSGTTEQQAVYTLLYAKDDTIRKVSGTHVLN